jgi:hypothetical protein
MKRLQGKEFADMKPQLEMIGYTKSSHGNYCAIMKVAGSKNYSRKYSHWLNNDEAKQFEESEFFKTHEPLTQEQVNNLRNPRALRNEVYQILEALNTDAYAIVSAQSRFDSRKKKLFTNYTKAVIVDVYESRKEKWEWLKPIAEELEHGGSLQDEIDVDVEGRSK